MVKSVSCDLHDLANTSRIGYVLFLLLSFVTDPAQRFITADTGYIVDTVIQIVICDRCTIF